MLNYIAQVIFICDFFFVKMQTRKEIIQEYKTRKTKAGVFQIRNIVNGKIYVSSNINISAILNRSKVQLDFGVHPCEPLQEDWKIFGQDKFAFEILDTLEPKENETRDMNKEIKDLEAMYLTELQPFAEKGYNRKPA